MALFQDRPGQVDDYKHSGKCQAGCEGKLRHAGSCQQPDHCDQQQNREAHVKAHPKHAENRRSRGIAFLELHVFQRIFGPWRERGNVADPHPNQPFG